jgi:hypothetical protein
MVTQFEKKPFALAAVVEAARFWGGQLFVLLRCGKMTS